VLQICEGLRHAHNNGIVHRDIKPGNILVLNDNRAKIVDFGFACALGTQEKQIRGTAVYLSPEQIKCSPVDERTDIYSLGIMAYEMFTGRKPCELENPPEILEWHLSQDVKDPGEAATDLPDELRRFIVTATRTDPEDRYRNVGRILHELEPLAERLGVGIRSTAVSKGRNMTGLFLSYRDEHQDTMQRLIREFGSELEKLGADMKKVDF
jgi:serine/threonine protein kinase